MKPIFNIDLKRLAVEILPTFLRGDIWRAFVFSAVRPLQDVYVNFVEMMYDCDFKLSHNSQTYSMRKMLNDTLDSNKRRFRIEQVERKEHLMLYGREEGKPVVFGLHNLNRRSSIGVEAIDFWVIAPKDCQGIEIRIKALVDYYKLASKRYEILYENE